MEARTKIAHKKAGDEIIVPYLAIENNIDFMVAGGVGEVELMDGTICQSLEGKAYPIGDVKEDIKRIYGCSLETWKLAWRKRISSVCEEVVKIKLAFND